VYESILWKGIITVVWLTSFRINYIYSQTVSVVVGNCL